jgi:ketosteroid isomerase-like protein
MTGDESEVAEANARFYRAFETLDIAEMERVWTPAARAKCVHPGWPLLSGWEAVRASWEAIFANTGEMRFTISEVQVAVEGDVAWVTCTENILAQIRGRVSVTAVVATNIFERGLDGWRLVHHHASHVLGGGGG